MSHIGAHEAALDAESDRVAWRLAVDAAGVGAFVWDLVSGRLRWDGRLLELFGLDEEQFGGTIESFNERVHPDDLPRVSAALERAIESCGEYDAEYRVVLPTGGLRWIQAHGRALADDPAGPAVRLVGAAHDTTAVREGEARVGRVLESMSSAFFQLDQDWRFTYVNTEAERLIGSDRGHLVGEVIWDAFPAAVGSAFDEQYRRAVASGRPVSFEAHYPPLEAWYEVRAWPSPEGLAVYFVDISARRRAQDALARSADQLAILASVSESLTSTLDPAEGVSRLSTLLVPILADWCLVTMVEDPHVLDWRRGLRDVGWSHEDPAMRQVLDRYASLRLEAMTDSSYLARTIRDELAPVLMETGATEQVAGMLLPGEARDRLRELAPESAVVVPLRARGRTVGVLSLFRGDARSSFTRDDVALLEDIGSRAALGLDNARLYAAQRDVSETLQRSLLTDPPRAERLQIVARYSPAEETARIGGDWYDAFLQASAGSGPPDVVVVVGDVVGHDVEAAAAMAQVRGMLRGIAVHSGDAPADILTGVDTVMGSLQLETTATAVVARFELRTGPGSDRGEALVRWAHAGHPPALMVSPDGQVSRMADVDTNDLLLGLDPATPRAEHVAVLEPGATLVFYTDGLVERRDRDVDDGVTELAALLRSLAAEHLDVDELSDRLLAAMIGGTPEDDVALLVVRLAPR